MHSGFETAIQAEQTAYNNCGYFSILSIAVLVNFILRKLEEGLYRGVVDSRRLRRRRSPHTPKHTSHSFQPPRGAIRSSLIRFGGDARID